MNIQTYQRCIQSLQKQIKSRQQQRASMQMTIKNIDKQLNQQINKNKLLRQQNSYLAKTKDNLLLQLKKKQDIINQKNSLINNSMNSDTETKQKIIYLEQHKNNLEQELKQKQMLMSQKNIKIRDLDTQCKKNNSLVEGYKNIVGQKARQISKNQTKMRQIESQKESIIKQLNSLKNQYNLQKQNSFKIKLSQENANQLLRQQTQKIDSLQKQIIAITELNKNQIQTLNFNHSHQKSVLENDKKQLNKKIQQLQEQINRLNLSSTQMKKIYDSQANNKDEVVNTLINQINFLKQQKESMVKQNQQNQAEITKSIIQMGLQATLMKEKHLTHERNIQELKSKIEQKDSEILNKQKYILKLNENIKSLQNKIRGLQKKIQELFNQRQNVKNQLQTLNIQYKTLNNQKQSSSTSSNQLINSLKSQISSTSERLKQNQTKITQLGNKILELQQKIKDLTYQKTKSNLSKAQFLELIKNHQFTIQKLQLLLDQSKKINFELSNIVNTKVQEINVLEKSNSMLRNQKLEWVKKQQDYRRKIVQFRNMASTGSRSFRDSRIRTNTKNHLQSGYLSKLSSRKNIFGNSQVQANHYFSNNVRTKTYGPASYMKKNQFYASQVFQNSNHKNRTHFEQNSDMQLYLPCLLENNVQLSGQNLHGRYENNRLLRLDAVDAIDKMNINESQIKQNGSESYFFKKNSLNINMQKQSDKHRSTQDGMNSLLDKLNKE